MSGKSHKPIVWGLFAGGGMFSAFVVPALVLVTGFLGFIWPSILSYGEVHGFAANWLGKLILLVVVALPIWHAAHRLRVCAHDFGIRADGPVRVTLYTASGLLTLLTIVLLLKI